MEISMKELLWKELEKGKESTTIQMDVIMKEIGRII